MRKTLIIRFSSFGDIAQALSAAQAIKNADKKNEIHWLTRSDFSDFVAQFQAVDHVWAYSRKAGLLGLIRLGWSLRKQKYDCIYDAHSNLRSHFLRFILFRFNQNFVRRSKERIKRILLFYFRVNHFDQPYRGAVSFIKPIEALFSCSTQAAQLVLKNKNSNAKYSQQILFAPSAAWELKKWPTAYWRELIELTLKNHPQLQIGLLGGPDDNLSELIVNDRVVNWAGKLSWSETTEAIHSARLLVSGDTGTLHVADGLQKPTIAIIGPTAFGYPSRATSETLEVQLTCKPCTKDGRGRCQNVTYKKCLIDIQPATVAKKINEKIELT